VTVDEAKDETGFLRPAPRSPDAVRLFAHDVDEVGYVMNLSRVWAHLPGAHQALFDLLGSTTETAGLTFRQRGILICSLASAMGDPYCSLAWGTRLAGAVGDDVAGRVLRGDDSGLDPAERALAVWARQLVRDPNGTRAADVEALREAGYDDAQILAITVYVALRIAFSTVNDALGARPDQELAAAAPEAVRAAVTFGRPGTERASGVETAVWRRGESNP
jgi:alkylhydroperoxidase family enzyme